MSHGLRRRDLDPDPLAQFRRWWVERAAVTAQDVDAIALATATAEGAPSVRMVLLRGLGPDGFRFFTNRLSRKGRELAQNPRAALLAYDEHHGRQMRVEGDVALLDDAASDDYWRSRSRASRLSAAVSRQSEEVAGRDEMARVRREAEARLGDAEVPRPPTWGGYRLVPRRYEFWVHGEDRFHDRFVYERDERAPTGWRVARLWP